MYKDLSLTHLPVTGIFEEPSSAHEWEKYRLSQDKIDFFNEHGYLSNIKLLEEWQVDMLNEELSRISQASHPGNSLFYEFNSNESANQDTILFHALGAWRITPGFHDILWNPAFTMAASQLLGNKTVRFWHDQLFCKPAHQGGNVAWHQDYSYWTRTIPMQHLTCWIALDDANTENGCLMYVPGSHNWGLLNKPELAGEVDAIQNFLTPEQKRNFKPIPIELKKGYATFHHPLLLHGSGENISDRSRRATVLNVFVDGTISNSEEVLLAGVPTIHPGETMDGQFFPVLLNRESQIFDIHT